MITPRYRNKSAKPAEKFINKYELTEISKVFQGETVYRIRALKGFGDVKKGDPGGWIGDELNLSQYGDCWVDYEAVAMENSRVRSGANLMDYALSKGDAVAEGECTLCDNVVLLGNAVVSGGMVLSGEVAVGGKTKLRGSAHIRNQAELMRFVDQQRFLRGK